MSRKYIIGTGFVSYGTKSFQDFVASLWVKNNQYYATPESVFVLSMKGHIFTHPDVENIKLSGDLGHLSCLLTGRKPHKFSGAGAAILTLAMIAYCNESDFIYKEQDSLCFGNWVDALYDSCGDGGAAIGPFEPAPSGTALMLFRHHSIPEIVGRYLLSRPEHDIHSLVEHHYRDMAKDDPKLFRHYSMGYDKRRPVNFDDETFWIQQPNQEDINELKRRNLL